MIKDKIISILQEVLKELTTEEMAVSLDHPADLEHGDYSTNVAMQIFGNSKFQVPSTNEISNNKFQMEHTDNPLQLAELLVERLREKKIEGVEKVEAVRPGFVNIWLSKEYLVNQLGEVLSAGNKFNIVNMDGKKMMVEFAHPNTHKEMHIGHMRTLITGEALARILQANGAEIFRANYQGDIGPHVAKAIYGTRLILQEKGLTFDETEKLPNKEEAHLLGQGYVRGNKDYEEFPEKKIEIDKLNSSLYRKDSDLWEDYQRTRKWSLEYYDEFYERFYTKFDRLFFESEVFEEGKKLVLDNIGRVFEQSEGAVVFPGEKYGVHTRVFITKDGNPTYEAKDMALAYKQFETFPFDRNIHVVANEQTGYFAVMIKALETLDSKFISREYHLPMGMVNLVGVKMSSRTGEIITVDELLDKVKEKVLTLIKADEKTAEEVEDIAEKVTIGAIKYSVLKTDPKMNAVFDLEKSVALDGNSGPYLQYTYARTQSVLRKSQIPNPKSQNKVNDFNDEEMAILRTLYRFPEIIVEAGEKLAPNLICNYLFDLAQKFNSFYDKHTILGANNEQQELRLRLTTAVGIIIEKGLDLLGIKAPERM